MRLSATESSFRAGHICVRVISFEEPEVIEEARELAYRLGVTPWAWSSVRGLYSLSLESQEIIDGVSEAESISEDINNNENENRESAPSEDVQNDEAEAESNWLNEVLTRDTA